MMKKCAIVLFMISLAVGCRTASASVLYASTNEDPFNMAGEPLFSIDQSTGAASLIGDTGAFYPADLTSDWRAGSFRLWAADSFSYQLFEIDPVIGVGAPVGEFAAPIISLAFDPITEGLYGSTRDGLLYEIAPDTAATTLIGPTGYDVVFSLAFDLAGTLYGISDVDGTIFSVDLSDGSATPLAIASVSHLTDIAARPEDGVIFAVSTTTDSVYTLDPTTGQATLVGPYDAGLNFVVGLAFSPVPEPATVCLLACGGISLLRRRRRHR